MGLIKYSLRIATFVFLISAPFSLLAADGEIIVVTSDTRTEWNDNGLWRNAVAAVVHPSWPLIPGATWIWTHAIATHDQKENGATVTFRRRFSLPADMTAEGEIAFMADNEITTYLNGHFVGHGICHNSFGPQCILHFTINGQEGDNEFTFQVTQYGRAGSSGSPSLNPAGFIFKADFTLHEKNPEPIVFVPGILTSFNSRVILRDSDGGSWRFILPASFMYRGLLERLESVGYTPGENLFISHYDWRQPNAESALEYLIPTIEQVKSHTGADKVDIVAHSMGGLVARQYIRSAQYANDVDQLIMLGTPNEGASDAYVAWEGGDFPERWTSGVTLYVSLVELVLKHYRNIDLPRPLSFRILFPSLKDLLPINDFVKRTTSTVPVTSLAEQNSFLQQLKADSGKIEERGVEVTTIAGTNKSTLNTISVGAQTQQDEALSRWRDGHPNPDPPPTDTTAGDQTVLLTSAHLGSTNVTIPSVQHDDLPEAAQEDVLKALGFDVIGSHIHYDRPKSYIGTVVLSPVTVTIHGPNGQILSPSTNSFAQAEYVVDEEDPNGPKLLMIGDPPPGTYDIELTGTGTGPYTIITSYADDNETRMTEKEGTTTLDKKEEFSFVVGATGSFIAPPPDVVALLGQLRDELWNLYHTRQISSQIYGKLFASVRRAESFAMSYERQANQYGADHRKARDFYVKTQKDVKTFITDFGKYTEQGLISDPAIVTLAGFRDQLFDISLANP